MAELRTAFAIRRAEAEEQQKQKGRRQKLKLKLKLKLRAEPEPPHALTLRTLWAEGKDNILVISLRISRSV